MTTPFLTTLLRTSTIPVPTTVSTRRSLLYIGLGNLAAGDILQINSMFQVTNPYDKNVLLGAYITLNAGSVSHSNALMTAAGANITPDIHHDARTLALAYQMPQAMLDAYLTVVVYAASSNAQSGWELDADSGGLTGFVTN